MAEIDKSIKLVFNEFQRSISEVPLEVYYQTLQADQFNQSGYQFNIKSPGTKALLDTDIWVEFTFKVREDANYAIRGIFEQNAGGDFLPRTDNKFAYRSGYIVQRATQNFSLQINNQTLNVRPHYFCDVLNRLYISNDQAEHEFSTSGGRFEEGNHGHRMCNPRISNPRYGFANVANQGQATHYSTQTADGINYVNDQAAVDGSNQKFVFQCTARDTYRQPRTVGITNDEIWIEGFPEYPNAYEFTNPGFDKRFMQMALRLRNAFTSDESTGSASDALAGAMIIPPTYIVPNVQGFFYFKVYERLPIPLFKMYSNDEIYGVIPNIVQMQIQGNFVNNLSANLFRTNVQFPNLSVYWENVETSFCKLYLRWYTAPTSMAIPREIHLPYKKIVTWSKNVELVAQNNAAYQVWNNMPEVSEYNISLEAIPDLLLIYLKCPAGNMQFNTPDDFNMEITQLSLNIDNASGKMNQVHSLDLYNKWKRLLKHTDSKIIGYEEWRRYCCVACLQPEDYGVRYGPGYSNPCVLGFRFKPRYWYINPSIHAGPPRNAAGSNVEYPGGDIVNLDLVVTQIFYKNKLIVRSDGTATQEMVKIAADFEMNAPQLMGAAGFGMQNA